MGEHRLTERKIAIDQEDLVRKKTELIAIAKRCFETGLQTNAGGNLSVRLARVDAIVIKPSGVGFNECSHDNLMIANLKGQTIAGRGKPSKDLDFHAGLYRARPDINAIVHVHSPWATGWASAGLEIPCLTVQSLGKAGRIPLIPLARNGGPQGEREVSNVLRNPSFSAATLENHGTIGLGKSLIAAQYLVELIEETAKIAFVRDMLARTHGLGDLKMPAKGIKG